MKIAFLASECAPYLKTGGLGDVVQALPEALSKLPKVEVSVFLPYYSRIKYSGQWKTDFLGYFDVQLAWRREYVGIFRLKTRKKKLQVYFLDNEQYFNRPSAYGYPDDGERFAYFSRACLESLRYLGMQPDIVHCHDWQTALVPMLLNMQYRGDFPNMRSILTIHNIEYQGKCGLDFNRDVLGAPPQCDEILRFDDCQNFLKAGIVTADRVGTVSKTYAEELRYPYYAHGLSEILASRGEAFSGIVNGINMALFDPEKNPNLAEHYSIKTMREGKTANKLALQQRLGLPEDKDTALLVMVTRLAGHKGIDLLCYIAERLLQRRVQLAVLGTGEEKYEWFLSGLQYRFPQQVAAHLVFDADLADLAYAAADLYLMPSKAEPCGLSQLIAMRYGTVPVVNATGGLRDTVTPYDPTTGAGRGFTFQSYNADDFLASIDRALALYYDAPEQFAALAQQDMLVDSSWTLPAKEYMQLYQSVCGG